MTGAVINTQSFGNRPESVEIPFISLRSPSLSDISQPVGKRWVNTDQSEEYSLTSKNSFAGITTAFWSLLTQGGLFISSAAIAPPMVNGTVVVSDPACLNTSSVFISPAIWNGTGAAYVTTISNGSFTITGGSGGETSTYYYMIVN